MNSSSPMLLHLQTVPARNGLLWIRHGLKVFRRKPLAMAGLLSVFLFIAFALLLLPGVGIMLLLMAMPILSLGFMLATHLVLQDQLPTAAVFAAPLKLTPQRRNSQLLLGACYALATIAIGLLSEWIDGGSFEALQRLVLENASADKVAAAAADPRLFWGAVTRLSLAALLSVPFWHAPALIHWGGQGVLQALFSSTLGIWRNRAAFAYNGLLWAALVIGVGVAASLLSALLGLGQMLPLLVMPLGLLMTTVFYASLYFTFIDCFMFGAPKDILTEKN
ncbi:BPSS1780 family membrane protein [Paucibacter sp. TC2R-5]|uniref:BPSS1780 family membrane protein n=1 Tax=Paucibacter sp. TC2R-5 TaxID=2893555 RepID=UPI0021E4F128|nr:BPSS1780 family membrane protein [Paucibacter sp. TC2R-5]